jgi:hypothetical protein
MIFLHERTLIKIIWRDDDDITLRKLDQKYCNGSIRTRKIIKYVIFWVVRAAISYILDYFGIAWRTILPPALLVPDWYY